MVLLPSVFFMLFYISYNLLYLFWFLLFFVPSSYPLQSLSLNPSSGGAVSTIHLFLNFLSSLTRTSSDLVLKKVGLRWYLYILWRRHKARVVPTCHTDLPLSYPSTRFFPFLSRLLHLRVLENFPKRTFPCKTSQNSVPCCIRLKKKSFSSKTDDLTLTWRSLHLPSPPSPVLTSVFLGNPPKTLWYQPLTTTQSGTTTV